MQTNRQTILGIDIGSVSISVVQLTLVAGYAVTCHRLLLVEGERLPRLGFRLGVREGAYLVHMVAIGLLAGGPVLLMGETTVAMGAGQGPGPGATVALMAVLALALFVVGRLLLGLPLP